ncbi:11582_t:CDS:2 [Acaulospora colombiana]|uniref:11582_t:CDS:1 n=1 Tax=Acaulospora colombiana TaxID=27376 RepID=A0ACA9K613_9GLOM|nr:11582_t:CDS:2 [Acaulospora colombiana]
MTDPKLLADLSRSFSNLFQDPQLADVTIEVGEPPDNKTFLAHSGLLFARSPHFASALKNEWIKRKKGNDIKISKPSIAPYIFEIILRFMYTGIISLDDQTISTILGILVAADEFLLEDLTQHLQSYLIESRKELIQKNFATVTQFVFKHGNFKRLQEYCTVRSASNPAAIFQADDFPSLDENSLAALIGRDDLEIEEIEIWNNVLRWGIAQMDSLPPDRAQWTDSDFTALETLLRRCLSKIQFFNISSIDFYNKVLPYVKLLPGTLHQDLLHHYLVHKSHGESISRSLDSVLLNYSDIRQIDFWINGNDTTLTSLIPITHRFNLIFRGSRDGFTGDDFHRLCDDKGPTLVVVKTNKGNQLIGGYAPKSWHSQNRWENGAGSFIFSLGDQNGRNPILSRYKSGPGLACWKSHGPIFGEYRDLGIFDVHIQKSSNNYCKKRDYLVAIIPGSETEYVGFGVKECEIFQVIDKLID